MVQWLKGCSRHVMYVAVTENIYVAVSVTEYILSVTISNGIAGCETRWPLHTESSRQVSVLFFSAVLNTVLSVQDFESDTVLRAAVTDLLEEMVCNSSLLPAEHKAAASILRTISRDTTPDKPVDLEKLLMPMQVGLFPKKKNCVCTFRTKHLSA